MKNALSIIVLMCLAAICAATAAEKKEDAGGGGKEKEKEGEFQGQKLQWTEDDGLQVITFFQYAFIRWNYCNLLNI